VLLDEKELPTLPEHLSSPQIFSEVQVDQSFVFCVVFYRSFVLFLFAIIMSVLSSTYGF
jgi:hypothetical protein